MIELKPSLDPGEAGYYELKVDLCVSRDEGRAVVDFLANLGFDVDDEEVA